MSNQAEKLIQQHSVDKLYQQLEKFKQQAEYVCLKLNIKDWITFLAEVRVGSIIKISSLGPSNRSNSPFPIKQPQSDQSKPGVHPFEDFLKEILQKNISTKRSTDRNLTCECESPICSEGRIKNIKGGDSSSSQASSAQSLAHTLTNPLENGIDPFQQYKIEDLWANSTSIKHKQAESRYKQAEQLYKNMQKYDQKKQQCLQGFATFRKPSTYEEYSFEQTSTNNSQKNRYIYQSTAKKNYNNCHNIQKEAKHEHSFERVPSEQWIKQSIDHDHNCRVNEFLLAVQNTKLRREIKHLQKMFHRQMQQSVI